jgi:hypothetical protein
VANRLQYNAAPLERWPLTCQWSETHDPLPRRVIFAPGRRATRPTANGHRFDFDAHMIRLCDDICRRCPTFRHVDVPRLLFGVTQARNRHAHGLQARVTPLRFKNGDLTRRRRGVTYQVQRYIVGPRDILYLVTFCLPRFLDLDFGEKLITVFHELYHISPAFDGDLRRHQGRYAIHSHSQRCYDSHMAELARAYLASGADPELHAFLKCNFGELQERYGRVMGVMVPRPKIIPISAPGNGVYAPNAAVAQ